jgi:lipopolysaccharide export system protein LptC
MAPVTRHTRIVALSKHFLMLLVAAMIAMVVWIASDNSGENKARMVFSNIAKTGILENIMQKPHYQGVDVRNRPFTVIADTATQVDKDNVDLKAIQADMILSNGKWVALKSGYGLLNLQTRQLELNDGVDLFYEGGYEFRTDHCHVDIQQGSAYGDAPVEVQGPSGTLKANNFTIGQRGEVIHFNGSVTMTLYR